MNAGAWLAPVLAALLATALCVLTGLPAALSIGLGAAVGLAMWRPPPRDALHPQPPVANPTGPVLNVGTVTSAPAQTAPVFAKQRFWLSLAELDRHATLIGATGSGKTTTIGRAIDTALAAGQPVLVVDAKGGRLADVCQAIATSHAAPFRLWLPGHPDSWTYDICAGDPTAIANRIVGAFEHGRDGQVYRNLSQALVPLAAQALLNAGRPCTLETLRYSLDEAHLTGLARREPDPTIRSELISMLRNKLHRETLAGIAGRLRALRFGVFGASLLPSARTLDLVDCVSTPGLSYLGLPATAASEDVALVGRALIQHLKQVAYAALWSDQTRPGLIVIDEFASLGEAVQLIDLLLQAREARLAVVVSTQHLPRDVLLRKALLSAGVLVVHQTVSEDKELIARTIGSRSGTEIVRQFQFGPVGPVARRFLRRRDSFLIDPEQIAHLRVGQAAICVRSAPQRLAIVQVEPLPMHP